MEGEGGRRKEGEEQGREGRCCAAYVPPDWDGERVYEKKVEKKQEKKQQPLTRRGRGGGGRICEAATVWKGRAAGPPVCGAASCSTHTHTHWRGPTRSRNINTSTRSCTYQTKHVYEPSKGFFQEFHHYCYFCLFFFSVLFFKSFILHRCARLHPTAVAALLLSGHTLPPHSVLLISREVVGSITPTSGALPVCGVAPPTIQRRALIGRRSSVSVDCLL